MPDPNGPRPPHRCPKHINVEHPPACGACGDARRAAQAWDAAQQQAAEQRRRALLDEIADCPDCDEFGWQLDDNGLPNDNATRCPKHDWTPTHA